MVSLRTSSLDTSFQFYFLLFHHVMVRIIFRKISHLEPICMRKRRIPGIYQIFESMFHPQWYPDMTRRKFLQTNINFTLTFFLLHQGALHSKEIIKLSWQAAVCSLPFCFQRTIGTSLHCSVQTCLGSSSCLPGSEGFCDQ